jgi:hypothetical protein
MHTNIMEDSNTDIDVAIDGCTSEPHPQSELPRWECEKHVRAAKITGVIDLPSQGKEGDGGRLLEIYGPYLPIYVQCNYVQKYQPEVGGYYVVYDDGFESYSPAKTFEDCYTPV